MIITRLHGRLGNQMFQFAAASGLAKRLGTQVALDPRNAQNRGEGALTDVFDLPVAKDAGLPPARHLAPLRYLVWRLTGQRPVFRREKGLGFNPGINRWGDDSYLHGYWQSERYFLDIAADIRRAFRFPDFSTRQNADMAGRIAQGVSLSLHVRRGDYLTLGAHVLCDQTYYEAALRAVLDGVEGTPTVYVFSDDPGWAKENLPLPCNKVVVDFNGPGADFEDMRLMSLCQHNIIANSSFSWWAAWLNAHSGKRVAGPANWFGDPKLSNPDILPEKWLKIRV
ncbi:MAG: alpha-1,2-fucosyltransferase [Rhodobacteraceae bacterium]|nr:alpha-1,2-fucosyltransferase [Paracoccaceae bacterium]